MKKSLLLISFSFGPWIDSETEKTIDTSTVFYRRQSLCKTLGGNEVPLITITANGNSNVNANSNVNNNSATAAAAAAIPAGVK